MTGVWPGRVMLKTHFTTARKIMAHFDIGHNVSKGPV